MTNYFCRIGGNDASAGTSAGTAWRTLGKALGASGMASGDSVFLGAGVYRETVTVAMTSAVAETSVIGDVDGAQTGDAGEVILTNFLDGWNDTPSSDVITLAGRDFLTFRNLTIIAGATGNCIDGTTATATNIKIDKCYLLALGNIAIVHTAAFATASNWTVQNSYVASLCSSAAMTWTLTTGVGADYDANIQLNDCVVMSLGSPSVVSVTNSGTAANRGGGVDFNRCTMMGSGGITTAATNVSTTIPCVVTDCLFYGTTAMNAGTPLQITDAGGNVSTGLLSSVTAHATTKTTTDDFPAQIISLGHEHLWGMPPRRAFAPYLPGTLQRGHIGSANTDLEGRNRPEGSCRFYDAGTATAGTSATLTDTGKTWKTNEHLGRLVRTTGGTGAGQVQHISANTATVLTISGKDGMWSTTPASGTTYVIYDAPPAVTVKATSGSTTTFVLSTANWSVNKWAGYDLAITAGTNSGVTRSIVSNTATTLTTAAFGAAIDTTSVGSVYWPGSSLNHTGDSPGAFSNHDTAQRETTTTDAGGVGIVLSGPGSHEFLIPVDATSTTISIKMQYDANHGTTNKPQALLLANAEIGVTAQTLTMSSAAGSWETLTFSAQTPTAKGVVTVRLVSRSAAPYGRAYADSWVIT